MYFDEDNVCSVSHHHMVKKLGHLKIIAVLIGALLLLEQTH